MTAGTTTTQRADGSGPDPDVVARVRGGRRRRRVRRRVLIAVFAAIIVATFTVTLMIGNTSYSLTEVIQILLGEDIPGADFNVVQRRLPRALLGIIVGVCLGLGGVTFQTMLRNPLASPDIIGISAGASAAAAVAIIFFGLGGAQLSGVAITAGLGVALLVYALAFKGGVLGTRLILIGIGVAAMLDSVTSYALSQAGQWELAETMRWLTGSLNGVRWEWIPPVLIALVVFGPILLSKDRDLAALRLGDDTAAAIGVRVERSRIILIIAAVGLIAFATAAAGPIAFVAFLSGPIAARLVGPHGSLLVPSALVGAALVLIADLAGQFAFGTRFPVGVVTGALGAPFLIYLIVRSYRAGGSL